jgi:hypothetical protein
MNARWYMDRLRRMDAREAATRIRDKAIKIAWRGRKGRPATPRLIATPPEFRFPPLDPAMLDFDSDAAGLLVAAAERVLAGHIGVFERETALPREAHDWFVDPDSGRAAPRDAYAFGIDMRDPRIVGNLTLAPSRLHHVTLLAAAYLVSGRDEFAALAAAQLRSWWQANPFLTGIHWGSGIEIGLRLVAFAWTRRLLAAWPGAQDLFENSVLARDRIYRHQQCLGALRSHGSSANNHLIAEWVGLYVGASAFPWFAESARWRERARAGLEAEAARQIFPDGIGRELASEYHGFTLELLMVAAVEGLIAGQPFTRKFYETIAGMADGWAALLDCRSRPPRQGDTDDAYVLQLDPPGRKRRASSLLGQAAALIGRLEWWPEMPRDVAAAIYRALVVRAASKPEVDVTRRQTRPNLFPEAGIALLRDLDGRADEIWCRCDHGPHGYLAIASHAHADALSIEVRHAGIDLLADPGTYCYLADPAARHFFRSTIAHNTLEIGGADQARYGGSFLWLDAPESHAVTIEGLDGGRFAHWQGRHEGYRAKMHGAPIHERSVTLDRAMRSLEIEDRILGSDKSNAGDFPVRLAFHLGPEIECRREGNVVELRWSAAGIAYSGRLVLPAALNWISYRGALDPMMGWYSPAFHEREPATSWIGAGMMKVGTALATRLEIDSAARRSYDIAEAAAGAESA